MVCLSNRIFTIVTKNNHIKNNASTIKIVDALDKLNSNTHQKDIKPMCFISFVCFLTADIFCSTLHALKEQYPNDMCVLRLTNNQKSNTFSALISLVQILAYLRFFLSWNKHNFHIF